MDANRFDRLARAFGASGSRRRALGALFAGLLAPLLPGAETAADRRRRGKDTENGKGKSRVRGKERDTPHRENQDSATDGAGDERGSPVARGGEVSADAGSRGKGKKKKKKRGGKKKPVHIKIGDPCGAPLVGSCAGGSNCKDGACACPADKAVNCDGICQGCCDDTGCGGSTPNCCDGICKGCCNASCASNLCCSDTCCANGDVCFQNACCTPLATCPAGACGAISNECGGTIVCGGCANPTPVCNASNSCEACTGDGQCGPGMVCCFGSCLTGVCCSDTDCNNPTPICTLPAHTCETCTGSGQCGPGKVCCFGSCFDGDCCNNGDCTGASNQCVINACQCGNGAPCTEPAETCCGSDAAGICQNTTTSPTNCGACGNTCANPGAPLCANGACVCASNGNQPCGGGQRCCPSGCRPLLNDQQNCGACGNVCSNPAAPVCAGVNCGCPSNGNQPCGGGQICCGSGCANLQTSQNNCGNCGITCAPNQICSGRCCLPSGQSCFISSQCCSNSCSGVFTQTCS